MVAAPRGQSPLLRRLLGALGAAPVKACAVGGIAITALLWCAVVQADEIPPSPPTSTIDAPPPDHYTPPPKPVAPKKVAPVTHAAPRVTLRTYTPPATRTAPSVAATPKTVHRAKAVHKQRKKPAVRKRTQPVRVSVAPVAHVVAAARLPAPLSSDEETPYLWLAGFSFAVLALAGLSLQAVTIRYFRPELR
jgi:type IV secretory pathway VirB10-like protein